VEGPLLSKHKGRSGHPRPPFPYAGLNAQHVVGREDRDRRGGRGIAKLREDTGRNELVEAHPAIFAVDPRDPAQALELIEPEQRRLAERRRFGPTHFGAGGRQIDKLEIGIFAHRHDRRLKADRRAWSSSPIEKIPFRHAPSSLRRPASIRARPLTAKS